jgi:beta-glucanase (GH16 family)
MVLARHWGALLLPWWLGVAGLEDSPSAAAEAQAGAPAESPAYRLSWSDEFDVDGPPLPENWRFERGFVRNQELQWYQLENASCRDGLLEIEGRRQRVENPRYDPQSDSWQRNREVAEYTSACLHTGGLHDWLYGRMIVAARIDAQDGLWPAVWTLGSARGWPGCGEIDIMEYYRGDLLASAAWSGGRRQPPRWDTFKRPVAEFDVPNWASKFHVWRMDWDHDFIKLYVDDELLNSVDLATTFNGGRRRDNPLREPHYILLNLAIGGTQGGDPAKTNFPTKFEIDYVRVYQLDDPTARRSNQRQAAAVTAAN